jgi:hypothetical protein
MKTKVFFQLLKEHQSKSLVFEYAPNLLVGANYHITEVKHIKVESVDCGANMDTWNETIIQLWESPSKLGKTEFMSVYKALAILNKVGKMKAFDFDAEIKFEYSNSNFHTAQMFVSDFEFINNQLKIKLAINKTDCKAKEECGISEKDSDAVESCCKPEGGCC